MQKKRTKIYEFNVIVEKDASGSFFAYVPSLQGCYSQGKTLTEALKNIEEAIELNVEDRKAQGEKIDSRKAVSISSVEVVV